MTNVDSGPAFRDEQAKAALSKARQSFQSLIVHAGNHPKDPHNARIEAEMRLHLAEAETLELSHLATTIDEGAQHIGKVTANLEKVLSATNLVLEKAGQGLLASGEQSQRSAHALVFWTRWMVLVIAIQAVALVVQVVMMLRQ